MRLNWVFIFCVLQTLIAPSVQSKDINIEFTEPKFVLPQFTGPFRKREVSVSPKEYEMAENLRELLNSGKKPEALAILDRFYNLEISVAMVMLKAQIFFQLEKYEDAEYSYLDALERMPDLVRAHSDLGQLYLLLEKHELSRKHFSKAVSLGANDAVIHGQLGYLNFLNHNAWSAISAYQNALVLEPSNQLWKQGLLSALMQAKLFDSAIALIDEMLNSHPNDSDLWLKKASFLIELENYDGALACMEVANKLGELTNENKKSLAQLHMRQGSLERGADIYIKLNHSSAIAYSEMDQVIEWLVSNMSLDTAKTLLRSADSQKKKLSKKEQSSFSLHQAKLFELDEDFNNAVKSYSNALKYAPDNGEALISAGELSRQLKNYTQSELYFSRAQIQEKYKEQAIQGKVRLFIDMKNYESALSLLYKEFKKNPSRLDYKTNIELLENIVQTNKLKSPI